MKYAILMGKYKPFNCEVLIDSLCLDCGFLNVRVNLFLPHHMMCIWFKHIYFNSIYTTCVMCTIQSEKDRNGSKMLI